MIAISLIWTSVGVVGFIIQWNLLHETLGDKYFVKEMGWNGSMLIVVNSHIRTAVVRLCIVLANVCIGIGSVLGLVGPGRQIYMFVAIAVLTASEIALVSLSQMDRITRKKILNLSKPE